MLPFVPTKEPDAGVVQALLRASRDANRFTNFGPVSRQLEEELGARLAAGGLVERKERVAHSCANATLGLQGAAGTFALRHGRPLRWVVSAYGFFSTFVGVFADSIAVDCDRRGLLDLGAVRELDADSYDGLIVTNPFGLFSEFDDYFDFCAEAGKVLLLDNAAGFGLTRDDTLPASAQQVEWIEAVSFHHTKPMGMGEGGAVILPTDLRETFRAVVNFGTNLPLEFASFYTNGKLSDFAAAQILAHLRRQQTWEAPYYDQARRVIELARSAGLEPLHPGPFPAPPGQIALLAPRPVQEEDINNPHVVLRKYYPLRRQGHANARDIWERVVNIPTHPGLAALSDATITRLFAAIATDGCAAE